MKRLRQPVLFNPLAQPVRLSCGHIWVTDLVHGMRHYLENYWKCAECRTKEREEKKSAAKA